MSRRKKEVTEETTSVVEEVVEETSADPVVEEEVKANEEEIIVSEPVAKVEEKTDTIQDVKSIKVGDTITLCNFPKGIFYSLNGKQAEVKKVSAENIIVQTATGKVIISKNNIKG